ncbi:DNA binding protein, putative [Ricinus communis]|uniref:DNA binding protein, putative n=1 Tax=Ricinus communis TaxID=3988 RepID=B9RPQ5_RICCO|nr:DNA binding protein, putative [Ricinus communis]
MCRGIESRNQGTLCKKEEAAAAASPEETSANMVCCELCGSRASLYCQADDAFLCRKCDKWVHGANFLANRHIRCFLCNTCQNLTQRYLIGASVEMVLPTMVMSSKDQRRICDSNNDDKQCSKSLKMPFLFL